MYIVPCKPSMMIHQFDLNIPWAKRISEEKYVDS